MTERPVRPLTPREAARALGVSLPTLRRYAQAWERKHGPLPRTPTGDRLWPREVVEAIADARARGEIGRLTRAKLEEDEAEAKGPEIAEITLRLEKVEDALKPFQDLSPRISEFEARLRHLALQIADLKEKLGELETKIEERTQRRPWWRFWVALLLQR